MAWLFGNLNEPFKILEPNIRKIHVNASMRCQQCQPYKIRPCLTAHRKLRFSNSLLNLAKLFRREIIFEIAVADFYHIKACLFGILDDVVIT